jgi:hypothetical protein
MRNPSGAQSLAEENTTSATSGVEEVALRLLGAFYDLSEGKLTEPVPLGGPETAVAGAAQKADLDPESTECAIAARYLVDRKLIEAKGNTSEYLITVAGFDEVREMRGMGAPAPPAGRNRMSDKAQQRLLTLLSIGISIGLSQPLTRFIGEKIPERRGIRDDVTEAVLKGLVRAVALTLASVIVRQIAASRR